MQVLDVDIQMSKDDIPVLIHSETLDSSTSGHGNVSDYTAAQLAQLDAAYQWTPGCGTCSSKPAADHPDRGIRTGAKPLPAGATSRDEFGVPTLEQVFQQFPDAYLDIELKPESDAAPKVAALLHKYHREDRTIVASFDDKQIAQFQQLAPTVAASPGQTASTNFFLGKPLPAGFQVLQLPYRYELGGKTVTVITPSLISARPRRRAGGMGVGSGRDRRARRSTRRWSGSGSTGSWPACRPICFPCCRPAVRSGLGADAGATGQIAQTDRVSSSADESSAAVFAAAARLLRRPLPFAGGGSRHRVGGRNVSVDQWLELSGDDVAGQLAEKRRLFETRRGDVLGALPGSAAACLELLDLVRENAAAAGLSVSAPAGLHPLEEAGRLVPEDFALHLKRPASDALTLVAGSICFPNRWLLHDKLGLPVTEVHDPVPGYRAELGKPVDQLMDRLPAGRVIERHNWGLARSPELFRAPGPSTGPGDLETITERRWLRIERQTLRRLPESGAVVFTIRTLQGPLAVLRDDPEAAAQLARSIAELPPDVAGYKVGSPYPQVVDALVKGLLNA